MPRTAHRHVRLRHMGFTGAHALPGPRPARHQAALLLRGPRIVRLRVGTQGDPCPWRPEAADGCRGAGPLSDLHVRACAPNHSEGRAKASAGAYAHCVRGFAANPALLETTRAGRRAAVRFDLRCGRSAPRPAPRSRALPAHERGPARRLSLRRAGQQLGGRADVGRLA